MPSSFWDTIATYASELAPVAGPLLSAVSDTASAIDRAGGASRHDALELRATVLERRALPPEPVAASRRTASKPRAKRQSSRAKRTA